jgi:hypothetical protein
MHTLKWLAVIAGFAVALAVIRMVFGESLVGFALFFILVIGVVQYLLGGRLGGRNWLRAVFGGIVATAVYAIFLRLFPK